MGIDIQELTVSFRKKAVLQSCSLYIEEKTITGLVAPNGYGKTTLLRSIAGLVEPEKGVITIDSVKPNEKERYFKKVFYLEDSTFLDQRLSTYDYMVYIKKLWHSSIVIKDVANQMGISDYYKKRIQHLSNGMKQLVVLSMALISDAPYIILDEPMNNLDPGNTKRISDLLRATRDKGKTILLSSHLLSNLDQICDRIVFIYDKKVTCSINKCDDITAESVYFELYQL